MCINLASTWYPRGELPRFIQLLPVLQEKYGHIVTFLSNQNMTFCINDERRKGRYLALEKAIEIPSGSIHYVDMDSLLYWVETK